MLVDPEGRSGIDNMASDTRLLDASTRTGGRFLRLYRWNPPTLSFGRNEPIAELYDLDLIARRGIATVRRPTGGKAVWHEHELTYAVAAPIAAFGSLRAAYREIHRCLAEALMTMGAATTLAPARPAVRPSDRRTSCFAMPAGGEILVAGRKLVGSAQVRRGGALLQHGSILLGGSQAVVSAVSRQPVTGSSETTLAAALGRSVTFDEVADAIVAAWPSGVARGAVEC